MANKDQGEIEIHIGNQTRLLRFKSKAVALLEDRLGLEPFAFVAQSRGATRFLAEAIFAGLAANASREQRKEITIDRIYTWLDDAEDLDREKLIQDVLYAIARGKAGEEAKRMVRALDEAFYGVSKEDAEADKGP